MQKIENTDRQNLLSLYTLGNWSVQSVIFTFVYLWNIEEKKNILMKDIGILSVSAQISVMVNALQIKSPG